MSLAPAEPEHELFLVYGKGRPGVIRGMDMNAKVPDEYMIPIENLMNPRALDFHAESEFIYFADATSYIIGRQRIDGTERDIILKEGMESSECVSIRNKRFKPVRHRMAAFSQISPEHICFCLRDPHCGGDCCGLDG